MGLIDKIRPQPQSTPAPANELNVKELEFLLILIKGATIKGENLEVAYTTVFKLQNQYLEKVPTK